MALPPWTIELLRRGISDVARKAGQPETLERIRSQASEILQEIPQSAARGIDAVIRTAESGTSRVRNWTRKHTAIALPLINASGVLIRPEGSGIALAEETIEVGRELMAADVVQGAATLERIEKRLQRVLADNDEQRVLITSNFSSALTALSLLVQERQLVVHRHHAVRLPGGLPRRGGLPLPDAFGVLVPVIHEVGSNDQVFADDFDGLDPFCAILADGGDRPVELLNLQGRDAIQAVVLPVATVLDNGHNAIPSAQALLNAGADIVVLPGNGIAGGPDCGIVIGKSKALTCIEHSTAWASLRASEAVMGMMATTLEIASTTPERIPVRALLATSGENLRGRAERMATRLTASDSIRSCHITADDALLTVGGRWRIPSRQLRLQHQTLSAEHWADELRSQVPAIDAIASGDALRIDLRWVSPADDRRLADALGGPEAEASEETYSSEAADSQEASPDDARQ